MKVVLTHDRADFDAIASQLGLALLIPEAVAIRPITINANVERFIAAHQASIPLVERTAARGSPIEHAWYVDTDHASDVPGMRPGTPRTLLDHHGSAPEGDAAARWSEIDVHPVGACATLVVERLAEAGITPDEVIATLLLLGIHEDTGSLRFRLTTPRDAEAVGWLIQAGARLDELGVYLPKPLDTEARAVFEGLEQDVTLVDRQGHLTAVAAVSAPEFRGEVAPLARRLLETQGAVAACAIVDLGSIIQLSARSASDAVDVGSLASSLGGGGHKRAAAAAMEVTRWTLDDARTAVVGFLSDGTADGAPILVRDVMTRGDVVTLSADLTVREALAIARRHGHEGYPVTGNGKLLSVIDRKDIDLAAHHGMLDLPLSGLIADGKVVARSDMPVGDLLAMIRQRGAAQVPVVEDNVLVGIVTRTDILAYLGRRLKGEEDRSPSVPIAAAFDAPTASALNDIADVAHGVGRRVYLVGGIPRDLALGRPIVADIDLVVDGDAIALGKRVSQSLGGKLTPHAQFGTAKWSSGDLEIDFVSARAEYYPDPGALPVVQPGNLTSDLRRRDFTINALAVALDGEDYGHIIDRFGGLEDLRAGVIRTLHPLSFTEDATRILRAVRFEARLGMRMSKTTERAARAAGPHLADISGARIVSELKKLFSEPSPSRSLGRLEELGALDHIAAGGTVTPRLKTAIDFAPLLWARMSRSRLQPAHDVPTPEDLLLVWLACLGGANASIVERLELSRRAKERLEMVARLVSDGRISGESRPSALHAALDGATGEALATASLIAERPDFLGIVLEFADKLARRELPVDGADIRSLGVPEGPAIGRILASVRIAWLDGQVEDRDAALRMVRDMVDDDREG